MDSKDTSTPEETAKPLRTVPVSQDALDRVKALQEGFYEIAKARISQTVITEKAIAKVTVADLLPQVEAA
jgi:hypothetical protein